jgi:16S rRNA G527 N7-methylase RsmG
MSKLVTIHYMERRHYSEILREVLQRFSLNIGHMRVVTDNIEKSWNEYRELPSIQSFQKVEKCITVFESMIKDGTFFIHCESNKIDEHDEKYKIQHNPAHTPAPVKTPREMDEISRPIIERKINDVE